MRALKKLILTLVFSAILLSSVISFPPAYSIPTDEIIKLVASDAALGDQFGQSVSISGDTAIVGAHLDDSSGSAYVFEKIAGTWTQVAKLTASDAAGGDVFGFSVSISGDTAIVGAFGGFLGGSSGSAYVFVKPGGGWADATEDAKLTASDAALGDQFGISVSISGDTAIVGASGDDVPNNSGSAYVFVKPGGGWSGSLTEDAKLTASDAASGDFLGFSASISGDTAIVSARGDDGSGSAYVFVKPGGGWSGSLTEDAKLTASDAALGDFFGQSVSISGDTAIVGAVLDDDVPNDSGSAYVFVKPGGGWSGSLTEDAKLTASDAALNDQFGFSVSISGDTAIVGAIGDDVPNNSGSAYVFVKPGGGWSGSLTEDAKLTASDATAGAAFGNSVSISGDTAILGAVLDSAGSAYIFGTASIPPDVSINDVSLAEGNAGTTAFTFTVTRSDNTDAISVDFATSDGSATIADSDYQVAGGTLSFLAGGALTDTITVQVVGDITVEPNETFNVDLTNCVGCTIIDPLGLGTIQNDDVAPGPTVSINDVLLAEGNAGLTPFTFTVTRSDNTDAISVDFATSDGTATLADNDYQVAGGTLSFLAGGPLTLTIPVQVNGDTNVEPNETFVVNLSNCAGCTFTDNQGQGIIQNDDGGPPIGGTFVPIDTTALLLAGVQSISMWVIPVVAAGIAIGVFVIKRRK